VHRDATLDATYRIEDDGQRAAVVAADIELYF
jgi:hypothetical protein